MIPNVEPGAHGPQPFTEIRENKIPVIEIPEMIDLPQRLIAINRFRF